MHLCVFSIFVIFVKKELANKDFKCLKNYVNRVIIKKASPKIIQTYFPNGRKEKHYEKSADLDP